jgi:hypothetical protein
LNFPDVFSAKQEDNAGGMNRMSPIVFFLVCGIVYFAFGWIKWHSVGAGVIAIICGLPLNALLFLAFRASVNGNDNRDSAK